MMSYLKFITWLIWLQNRKIHRGVVLMNLMVYHHDIYDDIKNIEWLIDDEKYDEAENEIDKIRSKYGEFTELVGLQTKVDITTFLKDR